jgi:hypothetical protein
MASSPHRMRGIVKDVGGARRYGRSHCMTAAVGCLLAGVFGCHGTRPASNQPSGGGGMAGASTTAAGGAGGRVDARDGGSDAGAAADTGDTGADSTDGDAGRDASADLGPIVVTVSGTAAAHPITATLGMTPPGDFTQLVVAVADPLATIVNSTAPPLAGGPLDTSASNCAPTGSCPWAFANVDLRNLSLGLIGLIDDGRAAPTSRIWLKTGNAVASAALVAAARMNQQPITDRRLFAVSRSTEAGLAQLMAATLSDPAIVAGSLESRGFILGTITGKTSQGGAPVAGATVSVVSSETRFNIVYPNATFTGVGTATAAHGTFLAVPKLASAPVIVTIWTVTAPTGDTRVWPALTAGSTPGSAFVMVMPANE